MQPSALSNSSLMVVYAKRSHRCGELAARAEQAGNLFDARDLRQQQQQDREFALRYSEGLLGRGDVLDARAMVTRADLGVAVDKKAFYRVWQTLKPSPHRTYILIDAGKAFSAPEFFEEAVKVARQAGDLDALAHGLLELENTSVRELQQAVLMAQEAENPLLAARGLLYLWDAQQNWLYLEQAHAALAEFQEHELTLDSVVHFPEIERIYRTYIGELLDRGHHKKALDVSRGLTTTEVENFLLADCFLPEEVGEFSGAIVRYLVLPEATWVFAIESGEIVATHTINVSQVELEHQVRQFFLKLTTYGDETFIRPAQELYDLLVRPVADRLDKPEQLIVVPDGALRTIPFSALHDGDRFLVERVALATSLSHTVHSERFTLRSGAFLGVPEHSELPSL
ncbi:MAG: CHAT domain-containing protein, partial [Cyanobacteria bacterium J06641_5]